MGYYADSCQYLAKLDPVGLAQWLIGPFLPTHRYVRFADTSLVVFPGESPRTCDTVAEWESLLDPLSRTLVDFEFQTEPHPDMLERTGEYAYRLRRELRNAGRKYRVLSVVTNLSGAPQPWELDMREDSLGIGIHQRILVRTLRDEDAEATLYRIIRGELPRSILPWVVLMRGADRADIIHQWREEVLREPSVHRRSELVGLTLVFAEIPDRRELWKKGLEGTMERTPQIILDWQAQARADGIIEGEIKGEIKGKTEGEAKGLRLGIATVLELRFGSPPSDDVVSHLSAQTDPAVLTRWLATAKTTPSVEDFIHSIRGT